MCAAPAAPHRDPDPEPAHEAQDDPSGGGRDLLAPARTALRLASRPARSLTGGAGTALSRLAERRADAARLDDRDSYLIRDLLPAAWIVAGVWFRAEVRGLHHVPRGGPVLLVGNASGGALSPDSLVLALGFASHFGPERPLHLLMPGGLSSLPGIGVLRRLGVLPAREDRAREALAEGGAVAVYPGGTEEAHRPSWRSAELELGDPTGAIRLALEAGAPIVPVVAIGGQETALFLGRGERLARRLRLESLLGVRELPLALALPFGVHVGDVLGHVPLPAKIVVQLLPPIDVASRSGDAALPTTIAAELEATMREMLDELASRRRLPVVG